jgi:hypothetical protein
MLLGGGARGIMGDPKQKVMKVVAGYKLWIPEPHIQYPESAQITTVPYVFCNTILSLPNGGRIPITEFKGTVEVPNGQINTGIWLVSSLERVPASHQRCHYRRPRFEPRPRHVCSSRGVLNQWKDRTSVKSLFSTYYTEGTHDEECTAKISTQ